MLTYFLALTHSFLLYKPPRTTHPQIQETYLFHIDSYYKNLHASHTGRYEMRVPWDNQWGVSQEDGNWTGTVGTLQHHGADFSMLLSWLPSRMAVVDYSRVYISEPLVIVTRKPGPLPQIFALVRPFPGDVI